LVVYDISCQELPTFSQLKLKFSASFAPSALQHTRLLLLECRQLSTERKNLDFQMQSLLSPNEAEIESPLAHIPLNPASSTIFALSPLCASIINSKFWLVSISRNWAALDGCGASPSHTYEKKKEEDYVMHNYDNKY